MSQVAAALRTIAHFFLDIIETVVVALAIFVVIYLFLVQPHQVNGNSMWPNFFSGEYLLTDKLSYRFHDPERGDVVVFHAPSGARCPQELQCDFVKRIIGLPDENIQISEGIIMINDVILDEEYLPDEQAFVTNTSNGEPLRTSLKSDEYFVLGDNRSHSSDSRAWGPTTKESIVGRAWIRYWPPQRAGFIAEAQYSTQNN